MPSAEMTTSPAWIRPVRSAAPPKKCVCAVCLNAHIRA